MAGGVFSRVIVFVRDAGPDFHLGRALVLRKVLQSGTAGDKHRCVPS